MHTHVLGEQNMRDLSSLKSFDASKNKLPLFAIVMGASGGGKSSLLGTMPGKTLAFYFRSDLSGPSFSASTDGSDIVPFLVDPTDMTADEAVAELYGQLKNPDLIKSFKNITIDGLPALEDLLNRTDACLAAGLTKAGKVDSFGKDRFIQEKLSELVRLLVDQRTFGVNIAVTTLARIADDGGSTQITPRLRGFGTIEALLPSFATILLVVRNNQDRSHFLDMESKIFKKKVDTTGKEVAVASFSTRIEGLRVEQTPPKISPDLKKVLALQHRDLKYVAPETEVD